MKLLALKEYNADLIFKLVVEYFHEIDVSINKMVMFTSDGASVMFGCRNGVQA